MSVITFGTSYTNTAISDFEPADLGPLTGSLVVLAGIAILQGRGAQSVLVTANLNVHGPTGSLVTMQIFNAVTSTLLAQAQITLGGNGGSDDYRCITAQASVWPPPPVNYPSGLFVGYEAQPYPNHYGFELLAQVSGGSATVIGGGLSAVTIGPRPWVNYPNPA